MKNYHCPNFFRNQQCFFILHDLLNKYPYAFIENVHFGSVYGALPNMIWNGGSTSKGPTQDANQIKDLFSFYKELNIPMKLTLTNPTLDEDDLKDKYCNSVLKIAEDYSDNIEILISSPLLEDYIRKYYPEFTFSHSILATKNDKTVEEYVEECEKYHHIVLPRRLGKNYEFLNSIPEEYRNRFEILCTDPCPIDCPNLYNHYEIMGNYQRGANLDKSIIHCVHNFTSPFQYAEFAKDQISTIEIANIYEPAKFSEFKLSGRSNITGIITMIEYFFKPEFRRDAYAIILGSGVQ